MLSYQIEFIEFALSSGVLKFGEFTLKSGRISPYFFNAGMFSDGHAFAELGKFYANAIQTHFNKDIDVLFGPAYKGIPLATATSIGLKLHYDRILPVSFNRKEIKDHGEGGNLIGASMLHRRVLLIDDVVTAGTTIRESANIIHTANATLAGMIIALDRQERGTQGTLSAIQEAEKTYGFPIRSIITLDNLIEYLTSNTLPEAPMHLQKIADYRSAYGEG